MTRQPSLIVLRGPSGSGKSSVASLVRLGQSEKMALVSQDTFRRIVLKEQDVPGGDNIDLIQHTILFALDRGYHVITEGIFTKARYEEMFAELLRRHPERNYFLYFDIPFDETLRRHATKPNRDEFGEKEMREWYTQHDYLDIVREERIDERLTQAEIVKRILTTLQLP